MRRALCILLTLAAVGCAPVVVPDSGKNGFTLIGEGASDSLQMKVRTLRVEADTLKRECDALAKRRDALAMDANNYRIRAIEAKRSSHLSASQKKAKFEILNDLAMERDREVKACDMRRMSMAAEIISIEMRRQTVLREALQREGAVVKNGG